MAQQAIRLDQDKPYSECRGERTSGDPHRLVHFFQTYKLGKKTIQLPFDINGDLIPDDGKKEPWEEKIGEDKHVRHPLYSEDMRLLVAKLKEKLASAEPVNEDDDAEPELAGSSNPDDAAKQVNLIAWLKGSLDLTPQKVREAMKAQHGLNPKDNKEAVVSLMLDLNVIPESELAQRFKKYLPG